MGIKQKVLVIAILILLLIGFPLSKAFAGNPPDAAQSSLVATTPGSDSAPADGTTTTSMTVTLKDSGSVALVGDNVSLSIPSDVTAVISPTSAVLDASGQAVFTITSTTVGTDSIDVTDSDASPPTTLTALGQVTFTAVPTSIPQNNNTGGSTYTAPSCTDSPPDSAPDLFQIDSTKTTSTLFFSQPSGTFDGYTVFYGTDINADTYNVSFKLGPVPGAIRYMVQDLDPKGTYYFKVRANNGCATGPLSPIRKAGYHGLTDLPATGPQNIFLGVGVAGIMTFLVGMVLFFVI